jgi:hypothetical protein
MMPCASYDETEELAMGRLTSARAAIARDHLRACAICRDEYDLLLSERELFERRAEVVRPAAGLEPRILAAAREHVQDGAARRARLASATRAVLALAACVTALVGSGWLDRRFPSSERAPYASESATASMSFDEPLACAFPVSGFAYTSERAAACASSEGIASMISDRGLCEERVTSSLSTP